MSEVMSSRGAKIADKEQWEKDQKLAQDKAFAAEQERIRQLDAADQRYYQQVETDLKAILDKHSEPNQGNTSMCPHCHQYLSQGRCINRTCSAFNKDF